MKFIYNDGGRSNYFKGNAGDCVVRAIAIAENKDYKETYDWFKKKLGNTPRDGITKKDTRKLLNELGWTWKSLTKIGSIEKTHLNENEIPNGIIIVKVSKHIVCIKDKVIYDTYDPSRDGNRLVYGYWIKER